MRIDAAQMAYFLHPLIDASGLAAAEAEVEAEAEAAPTAMAAGTGNGDAVKATPTATALSAISTTQPVPAVKAHEVYPSPRSSAILPASPMAKGLSWFSQII